VALKVIHQLFGHDLICQTDFLLNLRAAKRGTLNFSVVDCRSGAVSERFEIDATRVPLPLEVEHGVDGLNFDPPASAEHGLPDQARVVALCYNEFVAVFYVRILKGDLGLFAFAPRVFRPPQLHKVALVLKLLVRRNLNQAANLGLRNLLLNHLLLLLRQAKNLILPKRHLNLSRHCLFTHLHSIRLRLLLIRRL
jgi:hypothetical protein